MIVIYVFGQSINQLNLMAKSLLQINKKSVCYSNSMRNGLGLLLIKLSHSPVADWLFQDLEISTIQRNFNKNCLLLSFFPWRQSGLCIEAANSSCSIIGQNL
jgi:hypothetical protein